MELPDEPVALRVMVFNIEDGGTGVDLGKVVEAIRRTEPDVVALQEAMGNTARIADALGYPFASHRTQVISRFPFVDPPGGEHGPVFVEVRLGRVLALASVHLPAEPYGPELAGRGGSAAEIAALERRTRLPRLEPTLAALAPLIAADMPVFLLGDFNAPSHLDWTHAAIGLRPHVRTAIDWPVSRAMERAGFRDTWREIHPDPVADPGLTWWAHRPPTGGYQPGPGTPDDRIDMVYVAGPVVTTDGSIVGEADRDDVPIGVEPWPSDHRAVVATCRVRLVPMPTGAGGSVPLPVPDLRSALVAPRPPGRLETARPTYRVGEPIEISWQAGPGYRWDWIAVFRLPTDDLADAHLLWEHTDARVDGTVRLDGHSAEVDQASVGGHWPLPPGDYEAAYLLDDSTRMMARVAFTIVA